MHVPLYLAPRIGEVPEWSIGSVSKTDVPARVPGVRIPPSPPRKAQPRSGRAFSLPDRAKLAWAREESEKDPEREAIVGLSLKPLPQWESPLRAIPPSPPRKAQPRSGRAFSLPDRAKLAWAREESEKDPEREAIVGLSLKPLPQWESPLRAIPPSPPRKAQPRSGRAFS